MTKFIETKEGYINAAKITAIETYGSHGAAIEFDGGRRITLDLDTAIRYDIAKHLSADERRLLPGVLGRWVKRKSYLKACVQSGAHRVGLDGTLTPISEKEVTHAREKLAAVVSARVTERQVTP